MEPTPKPCAILYRFAPRERARLAVELDRLGIRTVAADGIEALAELLGERREAVVLAPLTDLAAGRALLEALRALAAHARLLLLDWDGAQLALEAALEAGLPIASSRPALLAAELRRAADSSALALALAEGTHSAENLAHELRTPLAAISGYASLMDELARERADESRESGESLAVIRRNAALMDRLIEDMVDSVRLAHGKLRLETSALDPFIEARAAVAGLQPAAQRKKVSLSCSPPEGRLPKIEADWRRLNQILSNLLANALKHTPAGGSVTVSLEADDEFVRFTVADDGAGIAPEHHDKLFERFYQCAGSDRVGGLGLGLQIARSLVSLHYGRIWVDSEPGQGARFHVAIPRSAAVPGPGPRSQEFLEPLPRA